MRVLLTTDTVGGVWTYTKELTEGLLNHGQAVALVSFGRLPAPDQQLWASQLTHQHADAFHYHASEAPLEWMPDNQRAYDQGALLLDRVAADFSPTLLHTNQFCFGRLDLSIPTLVAAHSDVLSWADACTPDGLPCSPWLTEYQRLVQQGLAAADAVVAPTRWMLDALAKHFSLPASRHIIANGRTLLLPQPAPVRQPQAVSAGRLWDPAKNIALLQGVRACPVLIAGADTASIATDISLTTRSLGTLPEAELLHLFRSSRIYIAASLYEPFGLAPLEAALCGCALVANDIPSLREVWGTAALFFTDLDELEQHLTALTLNETLFLKQQALSSARAQRLTAEAMTENYLSLYNELCLPADAAHTSASSSLQHVH